MNGRGDMTFGTKLRTVLSQFLNVLAGGHPDETLSARAYHEAPNSRFWAMIHKIANQLFGANHCHEAALEDLNFAEYVYRRWQRG